VALQPLLERVRRDLAEEALAKGLELTLVPCRLATRSDPILLERIVRNIATNAVRHTERGGVVMGVRRGEALAIEVWDTGPGIAPAQRELVFQEFFQVSNSGRDRAKGLGLGLAIVRRLTGLLGHPLTLESEPGKGSVFRIQVPRVPLIEAAPAKADTRAGEGGLILVVDDEAAIQEAMRALLESWGWRVIAAGGLQEMLARIQGLDCTPDLIISDFRLGGGEDGIAVIHRLRAELDVQVPAMLITGDTAPDRLIEARASGFLLLHKPVPNARLRAAIGNLVARAAAEQGLRRPRTRRRGRR
jgi:CheY-like chemotaxis protein/anti-sigma regulatory factor (Ser/Thr protein kinase)